MGIFNSLKDNLSSFSGEQYVKKIIEPYGNLEDFRINSSEKTIFVKVLLKGEKEPVDIRVNRYEVIEERGKTYIKIQSLKASREWITLLGNDFLIQQRFEIPEKYSSMIRKMI